MLDIPPACYRRSGRSDGHFPPHVIDGVDVVLNIPPRVIDGVDVVLDIPPSVIDGVDVVLDISPACYRRSERSAGHSPRVLSTEWT